MTQSIQAVAVNAQQATELEELAIDKTVHRLLKLRETVAHTAKKVQQLDAASQQISQVVALMHQIALQTPLLSPSIPLETPLHLGSQDLAAVAVGMGATSQMTAATPGTDSIQDDRSEATKQSLEQRAKVCSMVAQLMQAIARATASQRQMSQTVAQLMQAIALASEPTAEAAEIVTACLSRSLPNAGDTHTES
jgi:methyl-accepting chemotaxis protein